MAFKNLLQGVHMGSWGTPDVGVTEFFSDLFKKPRTSQGGTNPIGPMPAPAPTSPAPSQPTQPTQNWWDKTSTPSAPVQTSQPTISTPTYNPDTTRAQLQAGEEAMQSEFESRVRGEISSAYEPIFAALDERLAALPSDRSVLEKSVSDLVESQTKQVGLEKESGLRRIGATEEDVLLQAKDTRREIEQDIRNSMKAWEVYLGAQGAGDSSAFQTGSEAISREANKQVGKVLTARDKELANLGQRRLDVADLAATESLKIDQWKTSKLTDILTEFNNRRDNLLTQKSTATAEKANAIANLVLNSEQQFMTRMRQLDDQVTSYKQNVQLWAEQRCAVMEDYATKLKLQSTYQSQAGGTYTKALQDFNRLTQVQGISTMQARNIIINQYGIDPLVGLTTLSGTGDKEDEDIKTFSDWINSSY